MKTMEREKPTCKESEDMATRLKKLGMDKVNKKLEQAAKMKIAYGKYLFVTQDKITLFKRRLRESTEQEHATHYRYKELSFTPLKNYTEIPPANVLDALETAQSDKCFDTFEIAKVDWVEKVKDPILFGRIEGCSDYFFISQWDDDVKFEDILFTENKNVRTEKEKVSGK